MRGMPPDSISLARGMSISYSSNNDYNIILGIASHLLASAIAGTIFGFVTSKANRLRITGIRKGIGEGIVWSIIIFMIFYIPTTISMVQPNLLKIIDQVNPKRNSEQNQLMVVQQQILPLYTFGFVAHLVFGATLGCLMSLFVLMDSGTNKKKNID
jgi:TM2 domain-containing membrane protein YozV